MEYLNINALNKVLSSLSQWWRDEFLQPSIGLQLVVLLTVLLAAVLVGRPLKRYLHNLSAKMKVRAVSRMILALSNIAIAFTWLVFQWIGIGFAKQLDLHYGALKVVASLLTAWVVIRLVSHLIKDSGWSKIIAISAWTLAALNITGFLDDVTNILGQIGTSVGGIQITLLALIKGGVALIILLWLAGVISEVIDKRIQLVRNITPSGKALMAKVTKILLVTLALLVGLNSVGIDLTGLAIFSGALGVGLGFGLQKIFSNLVSGFILLLDKSIKPGDVIAVGSTYGWINSLGARYASVVTRDGVEHLIPNEELITQRVENWSHSNNFVRLRIPVGISYRADIHLAMELCLRALDGVTRVLKEPDPRCLVKGFGESSVDLELRVWITDPENGRSNMISEIYINIWDLFHEHGIEIPFPQRDLHIKTVLGSQTLEEFNKGS